MTIKENQWRTILAWAMTIFLTVMLMMLLRAMIFQAETMTDDYEPRKILSLLVMLSILAFKVFEEVLKAVIRRTVLADCKKGPDTEKKEKPRTESDPVVTWMRIIFSKEE